MNSLRRDCLMPVAGLTNEIVFCVFILNMETHKNRIQFFTANQLGFQKKLFWNDVQIEFEELSFKILAYENMLNGPNLWRLLCLNSKKNSVAGETINNYIVRGLSNYVLNKSDKYWRKFLQQYSIAGILIPELDVVNNSSDILRDLINFSHQFAIRFPIKSFIKTLQKSLVENKKGRIPIGVLSLWEYLMMAIGNEGSETEDGLSSLFFMQSQACFTFEKIEFHLPSFQLLTILITIINQSDEDPYILNRIERRIEKCHPLIIDFYGKYAESFLGLSKSGVKEEKKTNKGINEMRGSFFEICLLDLEMLQIQEIIDDYSSQNFKKKMQDDIKDELFDLQSGKKGFAKIVHSFLNTSILDKLSDLQQKEEHLTSNLIGASLKSIYDLDGENWASVDNEVQYIIRDGVMGFPPATSKAFNVEVQNRWQIYLQNLNNMLMLPILEWRMIDREIYPQINSMTDQEADYCLSLYEDQRRNEEKETENMKSALERLQNLDDLISIDNAIAKASKYSYSHIQNAWEVKSKQHRNRVHQIQLYRINRMKEFGIFESRFHNFMKERWLDEMLTIEDEIKPYINFVKKAFSAALPVRKTIGFNQYRHSFDGVEFDPDTILDQEKWLKGDVMKQLEYKIEVGEIEQVNTFCLDFSGSMDHIRMKNLFKIVYLLILGLEDKKSYDSIHFFSTSFVSCYEFDGKYTSRKLLFDVLRQITNIVNGKIIYGGSGGTNISDGVGKSHEKIMDFSSELLQQKPDKNIVKSIFIITDGEPSIGIVPFDMLNEFIERKRNEGGVTIKGIYIKPMDDNNDFMEKVFGKGNFVETTDFEEGVNEFVNIMTRTYKEQRKEYRWEKKRKQLFK